MYTNKKDKQYEYRTCKHSLIICLENYILLVEMLRCNDLILIVDTNYLKFMTYNSDLLLVHARARYMSCDLWLVVESL